MKFKAKFTGTDSLGYKHGNNYDLKILNKKGISIVRLDGSGGCVYESLSSFLTNWTDIIVIN